MKTRFSSRCDIALVGFAQSPVYRRAPMSLGALTLDTCVRAIEDAGLQKSQIDGLSTGPLLPAASDHTNIDGVDIVTSNFVAEHMGIRPRWYNNFQGIGQINSSVIQATNALAAGGADYVLLHRSLRNPPGRYHGNPLTRATEASQWTAPYGLWGPTPIALLYNEYMQRYGATREDMATLVVTLRENVANNPLSYWKNQTITREDYLDSRPIADPITILDCDIPVDFSASFILTTAERARDLKHRPVYLAGYAQSQPGYRRAFRTLDDLMQVGRETAKILWENSGLGPADVDVPQTYDGFSPLTYFWLECLGFCPDGEAAKFIQGGSIDRHGKFPLLSGGGSLGGGRVHGVAQMRECYLQLSQRAGEGQLPSANVGLACHAFPDNGGAVVYTAEPLG